MSLIHPNKKIPFWSAIITQTWGEVSIPAGANVTVNIQPPVGEIWLVEIGVYLYPRPDYIRSCYYKDYDGITERTHANLVRADATYDSHGFTAALERVLTNSLYARIFYYSANATTANYGYSGFKLSRPLWSPVRVHNPEEQEPRKWKRELTSPLPDEISALTPYAVELWDHETQSYVPSIMLEEDTVLARDPTTNFPVERLTVAITVEDFIKMLTNIKQNPEKTGFKKYLRKWEEEGIEI